MTEPLTCLISVGVFLLFRSWTLSSGYSGGLSSSEKEVGEIGSYDLSQMLHLLHCYQRPPPGGWRSQPGTLVLQLDVYKQYIISSTQQLYEQDICSSPMVTGVTVKSDKCAPLFTFLFLPSPQCAGPFTAVSVTLFCSNEQVSMSAWLLIRIAPTQICPYLRHCTWQCWTAICFIFM